MHKTTANLPLRLGHQVLFGCLFIALWQTSCCTHSWCQVSSVSAMAVGVMLHVCVLTFPQSSGFDLLRLHAQLTSFSSTCTCWMTVFHYAHPQLLASDCNFTASKIAKCSNPHAFVCDSVYMIPWIVIEPAMH